MERKEKHDVEYFLERMKFCIFEYGFGNMKAEYDEYHKYYLLYVDGSQEGLINYNDRYFNFYNRYNVHIFENIGERELTYTLKIFIEKIYFRYKTLNFIFKGGL